MSDHVDPSPTPHGARRCRLAPLAYTIRVVVVLWSAWNLFNITMNLVYLRRVLDVDLAHPGALFPLFAAVALVTWLFTAAVSYFVWRLFGVYLDGRTLAVDAALWMRRAGAAGLIGALASIVWRRLQVLTFTGHLQGPIGDLLIGVVPPVIPSDLARALFCLYVLALGQIFKAAAEIADDHARIV